MRYHNTDFMEYEDTNENVCKVKIDHPKILRYLGCRVPFMVDFVGKNDPILVKLNAKGVSLSEEYCRIAYEDEEGALDHHELAKLVLHEGKHCAQYQLPYDTWKELFNPDLPWNKRKGEIEANKAEWAPAPIYDIFNDIL